MVVEHDKQSTRLEAMCRVFATCVLVVAAVKGVIVTAWLAWLRTRLAP